QKFKEKPRKEEAFSNLANAGIYVLEPEVLEFIPPDQKFDFSKDLFPKLLSKGIPLYGCRIHGVWMDIGRPPDLWKGRMEIVRGCVMEEGARIAAGSIGERRTIRAGSRLENATVSQPP